MNYEIVTDSSANLLDEQIEKFGLHIISLVYRISGEEHQSYIKGQKTDNKRFFERLRQGEMAETSLIEMGPCRAAFESILKQGKDLLFIGFSSALSGSYGVAALVARDLAEEYPDRKILTVDTLAASMGEGLLVYRAAEQRLAGKSIEEVHKWVEDNRLHLCHWFSRRSDVPKRGGRISAATAVM